MIWTSRYWRISSPIPSWIRQMADSFHQLIFRQIVHQVTRTRLKLVFFFESCFRTNTGQIDTGKIFLLKIRTTFGQRTKTRQKKSGQTDTGQKNHRNPNRIRTPDKNATDKIRTDRHRTTNSDKIRTPDRHQTELSGKSGQKPDKDRTETVLSA